MSWLIATLVLYSAACGLYGPNPDAPLWLRWPLPIWNRIAHGWRRSPRKPDYAAIARLERELGIGNEKPTA